MKPRQQSIHTTNQLTALLHDLQKTLASRGSATFSRNFHDTCHFHCDLNNLGVTTPGGGSACTSSSNYQHD